MSPLSGALPATWAIAQLCEIAEINPGLDKSAIDDQFDVTFVSMPAVEAGSGRVDVSVCRQFGDVRKGYTSFMEGDVLFAKITPCMENGKMAVVPPLRNGLGFGSTEFHVLRPQEGISPQYLYYFVSAQGFRRDAEHNMTGAVGQRRVPMSYLAQHSIPLPPESEQRRIVARIEELFSELDKGVESLTKTREQLEAYRQALLKHAFEGKLTADWRKVQRGDLPTAMDIRAGLALARRNHWNGQVPFRRPALTAPCHYDTEDIPNAPNTWAVVSMDELCHHITSGSRGWSRYYDRGSCVFVMAQNVRPGRYDSSCVQLIDPPTDSAEAHRTRVLKDDLLVTIVGANTGDTCRFSFDSTNHFVCQSVALMRVVTPEYARYLELYFQAEHGGLRQYRRYIYGAGRPHLSFEQLRKTVVPLPSIPEAGEIARRLDVILSDYAQQLETINAEITRSRALRNGILKAAFAGRLVAQDPADEPATVLLARIRMEMTGDRNRTMKARSKAKGAGA